MEFWFDYKTFFMSNISIYHICRPHNQICKAVVKKRQIHLHISSWCLSLCQLPLILVPWNKVKRVEVKNTRINNRSTFSPTHRFVIRQNIYTWAYKASCRQRISWYSIRKSAFSKWNPSLGFTGGFHRHWIL